MLVQLNITKWDGFNNNRVLNENEGTLFLFNGTHINGIKTRATTHSSFMFAENLYNPREKAQYLECTATPAQIIQKSAQTWQSPFITVSVFPDNDKTQTAVARSINCESISFVYADVPLPKTYAHIVYYEGGKRIDAMVNHTIWDIRQLADVGRLSTS
jgi:hypothetical protein